MPQHVVLVLGAYGAFGSRIVRNLSRHAELSLIVAGRHHAAASALAQSIKTDRCQAREIDVSNAAGHAAVIAARPTAVIDTVGPFQTRDMELARLCARNGIHYVDIADARSRVADIAALDSTARANNAAIISGASTVPAITTAIVDDLAPDPERVVEIDVGISPGHRAPRGLATVRSILSYCGKPIPAVCGGIEYGWGGLTRHRYPPPVGSRWLSHVDTPERVLWRGRYPSLRMASIRAGLEIASQHLALSLLSRAVRTGIVSSLEPGAEFAIRVANAFDRWGTDTGAMHVRVVTRSDSERTATRTGTLIAERGDGPEIPAVPAALIVKKLLALPGYAPFNERGARPCMGLLTRTEIFRELERFAIRYATDEAPAH
jgi:hypothetical protein